MMHDRSQLNLGTRLKLNLQRHIFDVSLEMQSDSKNYVGLQDDYVGLQDDEITEPVQSACA